VSKNAPIGTCPCPFKDCDQVAPVFKYRARGDNELRRRHAGKLYVVCPVHGRAEPQEWILANATIPIAAERPDAPVDEPPVAPVTPAKPTAARPAPAPSRPVPPSTPALERAHERWGFFE